MTGLFITLEGVEGAGKSTQMAKLTAYLRESGRSVEAFREPGGTELGEKLRALILDDTHIPMGPSAETLLLMAGRRELLETRIRPALDAGHTVLCDRFIDSTLAYQGYGRGLGEDWVRRLFETSCGALYPDATLLLDLAVSEGLTRLNRPAVDRFERERPDFHEKVREGFLAIARREPDRVHILSAAGSADEVFQRILQCLRRHFGNAF